MAREQVYFVRFSLQSTAGSPNCGAVWIREKFRVDRYICIHLDNQFIQYSTSLIDNDQGIEVSFQAL